MATFCLLVGVASADAGAQRPAGDDATETAEVQQWTPPVQVGVLPLTFDKKVKRRTKKKLRPLAGELLEGLRAGREDVHMPDGAPARGPSKGSKRQSAAFAEAETHGWLQVVASHASGKGRKLKLQVQLLDVGTEEVVADVTVRPCGKDKRSWLEQVTDDITPFYVAPATPPAPTTPTPPAAAAVATQQHVEPPPPEEDTSLWPWVTGVGTAGLCALAVTTSLGGAGMGAWAWNDSSQVVAMGASGDRDTLEQSSVTKAMAADVLYVAGAATLAVTLTFLGGGLAYGLLFAGPDEEAADDGPPRPQAQPAQ